MHDTLPSLVERAIQGSERPLEFYLLEHSRLPGPRANLELGDDLAYLLAKASSEHSTRVHELILQLVAHESEIASSPVPSEFLVFCGVISAGVCAAIQTEWREQAIALLNRYACSASWRVREAVATAYQHLLSTHPQQALRSLHNLAVDGDLLQQRAAVAAIAEPKLLYKPELLVDACRLQKTVMERVVQVPSMERKCEDFRVLRRALGYTLSVVAAADPSAGFALMRECALWHDDDVVWILRENLKKKRLARFAQDTASILKLLPS